MCNAQKPTEYVNVSAAPLHEELDKTRCGIGDTGLVTLQRLKAKTLRYAACSNAPSDSQ